MYNSQFQSSPTMVMDICLNMDQPASSPTHNPMDLTSMLNPIPISKSSDTEEHRMSICGQTFAHQHHETTQSMEIDDEMPSCYPSPSESSSSRSASESSEPQDMSDETYHCPLPPMRLNPYDMDTFLRSGPFIASPSHLFQQQDIQRFHQGESDLHSLTLPFCTDPRPALVRILPTRKPSNMGLARPSQRSRSHSSSGREMYSRSDLSLEGPRDLISAQRAHRHRHLTISGKKLRKLPTGNHNNRPYTQEQLHWLRYHNEDCGLKYADMYKLWVLRFTAPEDARGPKQNFSSRLYRNNDVPMAKANGDLIFDHDGKPMYEVCKKRARNKSDQKDIPFKLWERHPEWAVYWPWVQPKHKALAQKILDGNLDAVQQKKERYRIAIRNLDVEIPPKKGRYATPAEHQRAMSLAQSTAAAPPTPPLSTSSMSPDWNAPTPFITAGKTE